MIRLPPRSTLSDTLFPTRRSSDLLAWHVSGARGLEAERTALRSLLRGTAGQGGTALVYAGTRRVVEAVRDHLAALGLRAEAYHAGLEAEDRKSTRLNCSH